MKFEWIWVGYNRDLHRDVYVRKQSFQTDRAIKRFDQCVVGKKRKQSRKLSLSVLQYMHWAS